MCVIVAKPADAHVSLHITLADCWHTNSDGAGIAWYEDGKLRLEKGFMTWSSFSDFWEKHEQRRSWDSVPAVIHFRIATHGLVNKENTHPFWVFPGKLAFAHNGILYGRPIKKRECDISDTQIFNRHYLKQLPRNFLSNNGIRLFIDDFLGMSNKLAFIDNDGEITIFGEDHGTWDENGVWFSNTNHEVKYLSPINGGAWGVNSKGFVTRDLRSSRSGAVVWSAELQRYVDVDDAIDAELEEEGKPLFSACEEPWLPDEHFFCYYCETTFTSDEVDEWDELGQPVCPICIARGSSVPIDIVDPNVYAKYQEKGGDDDE
jgi:hypothetical protein